MKKPCWFCGSKDVRVLAERLGYPPGMEPYFVMCQACCARGPSRNNYAEAIQDWNKAGAVSVGETTPE